MFGRRLANLRKLKGLTQEELADRLSLTRSTYAQYEIGRREPDFKTILKLADFFNISVDYILGRDQVTMAAHRSDDHMGDLPEEARRDVEEYIEYVRHKYRKGDGRKDS